MQIKLKDILLGKHDREIQPGKAPLVDLRTIVHDEPQTHKLLLPLEVPAGRWKELNVILGNLQGDREACTKLKTLLVEVIQGLQ